jgi:drug/metabolite transporter (DMT)-like permease
VAYEQVTTSCGLVAAVAVAATTILRQRRLETADIGSFVAAFMGGCNLPASVFLCCYGFSPDPPEVATKLHGYEKYVALAGVCLLFLALVGIWTLLRKAYAK